MTTTPLAAAIVAAFVAAFVASSVCAEEAADGANRFDELARITVSATLAERAQKDVASEVSVIHPAQIDARQVTDIGALVRYEPGVSVSADGSRFGRAGFSVRGLDGNRVRIELDGVAVPDTFAIGSFSNAGRDVVDVDVLKRVEILRGAASSLYGSDALAGVVSFVTKDPASKLTMLHNTMLAHTATRDFLHQVRPEIARPPAPVLSIG